MEIKNIPFENGELLGIRTPEGEVYLAVKKACIDIGLTEKQAQRQVTNVQEDLVLKDFVKKLNLKFGVQVRETVVIKEDAVAGFFYKISLTPKMQKENPEAVAKLVRYQLKAQQVLHEAFMATEEQKQEFYDELGLKGQIIQLEEKVDILSNRVNSLIDNSTINSRQAQKILFAGKDRVSEILGGAHSDKYKALSRTYFKNMWLNFCGQFEISSYKDLCPVQINNAYRYLTNWSML